MDYIKKEDIVSSLVELMNTPVDEFVATKKLNKLTAIQIIPCEQCRFHMDCHIEKLLPNTGKQKFCSYGKSIF